ncbi:hypothetical protein WOLCODRAFT_16862 [Wolfiporia cocos MD-104 SS10]|uniref:Uncharacterized protein n=1 Tax=Wolfiporia cocos (strain MD-104) TaxID=742152 RepID=A0A2H3JMF7_WOLCO|nr:hypothetical protein WOLCODRAFT_16862 [Wolfiporia cocos MD-104 SS10]
MTFKFLVWLDAYLNQTNRKTPRHSMIRRFKATFLGIAVHIHRVSTARRAVRLVEYERDVYQSPAASDSVLSFDSVPVVRIPSDRPPEFFERSAGMAPDPLFEACLQTYREYYEGRLGYGPNGEPIYVAQHPDHPDTDVGMGTSGGAMSREDLQAPLSPATDGLQNARLRAVHDALARGASGDLLTESMAAYTNDMPIDHVTDPPTQHEFETMPHIDHIHMTPANDLCSSAWPTWLAPVTTNREIRAIVSLLIMKKHTSRKTLRYPKPHRSKAITLGTVIRDQRTSANHPTRNFAQCEPAAYQAPAASEDEAMKESVYSGPMDVQSSGSDILLHQHHHPRASLTAASAQEHAFSNENLDRWWSHPTPATTYERIEAWRRGLSQNPDMIENGHDDVGNQLHPIRPPRLGPGRRLKDIGFMDDLPLELPTARKRRPYSTPRPMNSDLPMTTSQTRKWQSMAVIM